VGSTIAPAGGSGAPATGSGAACAPAPTSTRPPPAAQHPARPPARRPTSLGHRPGLDGLRGLAVLLVLVMHAGDTVWQEREPWLAVGGSLGVDMFLVLSGFLITALLLTERERTGGIDLAGFAARRARRLLPGLVALFAVVAVVAAVGPALELRDVVAAAVQDLTFLTHVWRFGNAPGIRDVVDSIGTPTTDVGHLWTVALEVQFYALWGFTLWAASRARWSYRRLLALALGGVVLVAAVRAVRMGLGSPGTVVDLYATTASRLDAPLLGSVVGLAWWAGLLERVPPRLAAAAAAVGAAGWLVGAFTLDPYQATALPYGLYTVTGLGCAAVVVGVLRAPAIGVAALVAWRPLRFVGVVSYSLYLFHLPLFEAVDRTGLDLPGAVRFGAAAGTAVAVAWASHRFVERPWLSRRPIPPAGDTPLAVAPEPIVP
jgi:peptidoglycan/LPS O-acetylase OafA/YrhL